MTSIFGWKADDSGCGYYRLELPLTTIQEAHPNWRVESHTHMPDWVRDSADVIIAQRTCMPGPSKLWQSLCASGKYTTVFEVDDDLFNVEASNAAAHRVYTSPAIRDALLANAAAADLVTVSTEPLAEIMRAINPNVVVLANGIPDWLLSHNRIQNSSLTVGWGGSGSHVDDVAECSNELKRFVARNKVDLHLMGSPFKSFGPARVSQWNDGVESYLKAIDFDIALAPLKPTVFNRSKSDLRLCELSALGISTIASNTGPYATSTAPTILVDRPHEWTQALRTLANDADQRAALGTKAHDWAASRAISLNAHLWTEAYGLS